MGSLCVTRCKRRVIMHVDVRTFHKHLKGQVNDKKAAPVKQSISFMCINDIISGKKSFPHLSKNMAETWVMDEEEI